MEKNYDSAPTKLMIYRISPMSKEGFERFGNKMQKHIAKSPLIHKPNIVLREIPCEVFKDDKSLAEYLLQYLPEGSYRASGWNKGATRTHVKLTKTLFNIEIFDVEQQQYSITNTRRLGYYGIRKYKNRVRQNE